MAQAGVARDAVGLEVDVAHLGAVSLMWVPIEGAMRRLRTENQVDGPANYALCVRPDEAAAWSLKRTLLRDSPGDSQWGVKGAPWAEGPHNDHWCSFPPGAGVLGGSFSGRSQRVFKRFRHRPTNPPRSAPRDIERRESDRSTHLSQIRGRKAYLVRLTCNAYVTAA